MLKTDWAKLWLLCFIVALSGATIGLLFLNSLFMLLALVAMIILTVRYQVTYLIATSVASTIICIAIYGGLVGGLFLGMVLIPGALMGYKAKVFSSPLGIFSWGMLPYLLPLAMIVILYPQLTAEAPVLIDEMRRMILGSSGVLGMSAQQQQLMQSSLETTINWVLRLAPGVFFTIFVMLVLFALLGATLAGPYFGAIIPRLKPLYLWKIGELWLLPLGFALIATLLGGHWLKITGENMLVFLVHLYAFFGLCLVDFYFKKLHISLPVRLIIYLFVMVAIVIALPVLALIGLIDSRFDFRKISHLTSDSGNII